MSSTFRSSWSFRSGLGRRAYAAKGGYPATVLGGVIEGMPAFDDETFGPVAAITRVPDVDAAIRAANASQFGLSGNLWTKDIDLARRVARDLYTGGVFINGVTSSDQRVPVGGVKNSGYGRELSQFGAYAFVKPANRLNREPVACVWQTGSGTQSNPCGKWGQGQIA